MEGGESSVQIVEGGALQRKWTERIGQNKAQLTIWLCGPCNLTFEIQLL